MSGINNTQFVLPLTTIGDPMDFVIGPIMASKNLTANTTLEVVHIANFPQFFRISAFFIAFILFYLITVPLLMQFVFKSWKVIGGLVSVLRSKGYST